jgi:hypothetical protein
MPATKRPSFTAVSQYWKIEEQHPAEDGSVLYLRVPPEIAKRVKPVRFPPPRQPK